ncbi:MAG: response regulator [Rhodovulum sp.]
MPRIAVIDDEPEFLDLLPRLLAGSGFEVDCAATPEAFFALLAQAPYDAVLVDFWLGHDTALGVLDRLAAEARDLPVILVSGGGGGHSAEMAEALGHVSGVAAFLHKPFRRDELLRTLTACARR